MRTPPPRLARWLLDRLLPHDERSATIRGDLLEELRTRAAETSPAAAARWYRRQALAVLARVTADRWRRRASRAERAPAASSALQDVRFAVRGLVKSPGFSLAALATLTIGIGASTAIFSIINGILLRPLPYADPDRLVWINETAGPAAQQISIAWPDFVDWRTRAVSFDGLACSRSTTFNLTGTSEPEHLLGRQATWNFLQVLGIRPVLGRLFRPDDDQPAPVHPVLISDGLWRRRFGGDPGIIGRRITLNDAPHEVVGVLPPHFHYVQLDDVYEPIGVALTPHSGLPDRGNHNGVAAIARLRPGVTEEAARGEMLALSASLTQEHPDTNSGDSIVLMSMTSRFVGTIRPTLLTLLGAVGFLLLLACVNVANLLVARGASRAHEFAVRAALGCGRWRLVRQLLVENAALAFAGGGLGVLAGAGLLRVLVMLAPPDTPRLDDVHLDGMVVLFALGATIAAALIFGIVPAIHASRARDQHQLVRVNRGDSARPSTDRLRRLLMIAEVAVALVLLAGGGLMMRTMQELARVNPGFDAGHLLSLRYSMPVTVGPDRARVVWDSLLARTRAVPGVTSAALAQSLPIDGSRWNSIFMVADQPVPPRAQLPSSAFIPVSDGYFETMRMRLVAGRFLHASDTRTSQKVAVVNETFARRFWPHGSAVGKRFKQGWPETPGDWRDIVGVVGDVPLEGVKQEAPLQTYLPLSQEQAFDLALVLRVTGDPAAMSKPVQAALHETAPDVAFVAQTMDELMRDSIANERISLVVLGVFGFVALALACVGLAGVVSQSVTQRTREIGIRMALGADRGRVVGLFVGQALVTTAVGIAIGLPGALLVSRLIRDLLFHVAPDDVEALASVSVVLLVVTLAACGIPARRASRVSPTVALRGE